MNNTILVNQYTIVVTLKIFKNNNNKYTVRDIAMRDPYMYPKSKDAKMDTFIPKLHSNRGDPKGDPLWKLMIWVSKLMVGVHEIYLDIKHHSSNQIVFWIPNLITSLGDALRDEKYK